MTEVKFCVYLVAQTDQNVGLRFKQLWNIPVQILMRVNDTIFVNLDESILTASSNHHNIQRNKFVRIFSNHDIQQN